MNNIIVNFGGGYHLVSTERRQALGLSPKDFRKGVRGKAIGGDSYGC